MKKISKYLLVGCFMFGIGQAWAVDTDLSETPEVQFLAAVAEDLKNKADELVTTVKIYEYIRNNTEYALYHGSRSGSVNTFLGGRGSDVDIASAMIAMLRSQNIRSRYAEGNIQVTADDIVNWLGVKDLDLAAAILDDQGIQNVLIAPDRSYVEFEHVWVEVLTSYSNYRGAGPDASVDCNIMPADCQWVSLDPSFKLRTYHNQGIDIYGAVSFDYTSYYNAIKDDNPKFKDKNPIEIYEEQILEYLQINLPGKTLEDVADPGVIITDISGMLPASLPYTIVAGTVNNYNSVADHDAVAPKFWAKYITLDVAKQTQDINGNPVPDPNVQFFTDKQFLLVDLATKRLTLTFDACGIDCVIVNFRLDGQGAGGSAIGSGQLNYLDPFIIEMQLDGAPSTQTGQPDSTIDVTYTNNVVGGYYLIGTGGDSSNWSQVHRAAEQLLAANEQNPIAVDDAGAFGEVGEPYLDLNSDGLVNTGEPRLIDDKPAMDALTGGLLYSAMSLYFTKFREGIERLDNLNHIISPIEGFVGIVSTVFDVEYLDNTAFSVMPGGLLIDMKGQRFSGSWRDDAPAQIANDHFELIGHITSSLEHEIWQEITGFEAVSTVRGIQFAVNNGATVESMKKNATEDTLAQSYTAFGYTVVEPDPFAISTPTIFSTKPAVWSNPFLNQSFNIFKSDVDLSTTSTRLLHWTYTYFSNSSGPYAWVTCINGQEDWLKSLSPIALVSGAFCDGTPFASSAPNVLADLQTWYNNIAIPNYIGQGYMDFFNMNQGFVPSEYVYRDVVIPIDYQDSLFVASLRNGVSLIAADEWREYVIPSRKTLAGLNRFVVYIDKRYDNVTNDINSMSFIIKNDSFSAGGGYVDGADALVAAEVTSSTVFNNELFTNQNLNAQVNNDLVITPSTVDPVSTVTGNMYHDETDILVKGIGLDYALTRSYNSGTTTTTSATGIPLSKGWTHSYNMRLVANDYGEHPNYDATLAPENTNTTTSSITFVDERGGEVNYLVDDIGPTWAITQPHGVFDTLELDVPVVGQYTLTFRNGVKYIFSGNDLKVPGNSARLILMQDPYGQQLNFGYTGNDLTSITDNLGITGRTGLVLTYYATGENAGRLDKVTDWAGRFWDYQYTNGQLSSVTNPLGDANTYTYHPGTDYLKDVAKPEDRGGQQVTTTFSYYRNGKAFDYVTATGDAETLDYDLYRKRTRITDPRGFVREHYYDANGALTKLVEPDKGILFFENTDEGQRYTKTDGLGYKTQYSYQPDRLFTSSPVGNIGQITREQDALGNAIDYTYGIYDQIVDVTDKNNVQVINEYYATTDNLTGALTGKLQRVILPSVLINGVNQANVVLAEYQYNSDGTVRRIEETIDPAMPTRKRIIDLTYVYDAAGYTLTAMITGATSGGSITAIKQFDSLWRLTSETVNRRTSAVDATPLPLTTSYEYDDLSRPVRVTDPLGNIAETIYDKNGQVFQIINHYKIGSTGTDTVLQAGCTDDATYHSCVISARTYDANDRLISEANINGDTIDYQYDEIGNVIKVTNRNGHGLTNEYDAMNRLTKITDENGYSVQTKYDLAGRVTETLDGNGKSMKFEYNALGRLTKITSPENRIATIDEYDGNGNIIRARDANAVAGGSVNFEGATTYKVYDEFNRVISENNANNETTTYTYDLLGNLTSVTDALSQTTTFVYDDLGRLIETKDPIEEAPTDKTVTYTYDEVGNRLTVTDHLGETTRTTFDTLNRATLVEYLADTTTQSATYDQYGDNVSIANADVIYSYTYDNRHLMTSKIDSRNGKSLSWTYDAAGNGISKTDYQGSVTTFTYDDSNRLVAMANPAYLQASYQYDGAGRLLSRILSNGVSTLYNYDKDGFLTKMTQRSADGTLIDDRTYGHDNIGNITSVLAATETINYGYDPVYRLLNADSTINTNDQSWAYDGVGNRLTMVQGGTTYYYNYNNNGNRLDDIRTGSPTGSIVNSYDYDDNGSRIAKRDSSNIVIESYVYDQRRLISQIDTNTYGYDPNAYRINKTTPTLTNNYLLEGEHLEATYDENNSLKASYLRGVIVDEIINGFEKDDNSKLINRSYHHDQVNSVLATTGHTGVTTQTNTYGPFGLSLNTSGIDTNTFKYTGRENDNNGLYYYRARYYDPFAGRFLSEDLKGFKAGINFYAYVGNNPLNFNDPMGLDVVGINTGGEVTVDPTCISCRTPGTRFSLSSILAFDTETFELGLFTQTETGLGKSTGVGSAGLFINAMIGDKGSTFNDVRGESLVVGGSFGFQNNLGITFAQSDPGINARGPGITEIGFSPLTTSGSSINLSISNTIQIGSSTIIADFRDTVNQFIVDGITNFIGGRTIENFLGPLSESSSTSFFDASSIDLFGTSGANLFGASGGFVIYPSRLNTNQLESVYSK